MKRLELTTRLRMARYSPADETAMKEAPRAGLTEKWVHVCSVSDKTRNGAPVTGDFLSRYVADFYTRPEPGPVYLGHADADLPPGTEEPPARAWVLALEFNPQGELWALYALTPELEASIRKGHYLFNSIYGAFKTDEEGNVTDAQFISIAVTNQPAVPNLTPMAAKAKHGAATKDLYKEALRVLPDDAEPTRFLDYVNARLELDRVIEGERTETMDAQPTVTPAPVAAAADVPAEDKTALVAKLLMDLSGMDAAAIVAAIEAKPQEFAALLGAGAPQGATADQQAAALLQSTIKTLSAKIDELEKAASTEREGVAKAKAVACVDELVKAGRVLDAEKDGWIALATTSPAQFEMLSTSLKPAVPTGTVIAKPAVKDSSIADHGEDQALAHTRMQLMAAKVRDIDGALARHKERHA